MRKTLLNFVALAVLLGTTNLQASEAESKSSGFNSAVTSSSARYFIPHSQFFSYDTSKGAAPGYLHVDIKREKWTARDIRNEDIPFTQALFANKTVTGSFADGQVLEPDATAKIISESWIPRFANGQPHGGLTVFMGGKEVANAVAGLGDRAGTSEIALAILPEFQNGKLATELCQTLVTEWAPVVRGIGLGVGLSEGDMPIVNAFRCFGEDSDTPKVKVLNQLEATSNPSNVGSWLVLAKNGFKPARCDLIADYDIIDLTTGKFEFSGGQDKLRENFERLESHILATYFDASKGTDSITADKRCILIDPNGTEFTLSKHAKWGRLKLHWEYPVTTHS